MAPERNSERQEKKEVPVYSDNCSAGNVTSFYCSLFAVIREIPVYRDILDLSDGGIVIRGVIEPATSQ